ncbi:hypothetical protein J5N97_006416 [Dioscorea zingiberensis]|uniref:Homeobox-leucine zipper protein n=1 Tax=Dioscorea zingiberensis TaxID=325984 RepID=A0A9D5DC62_9LILI|nr:hypothetical protein J5N97_006416 [Dioscorea zingiberensis]
MSGKRVYGDSSMAILLKNEGIPAHSLHSLLVSGSNPGGFLGSRSMMNFEDVGCANSSEQGFYRPFDLEETVDEDLDEILHQPEKKRRLTVDQVQFLEKSFELENKLEPERKIQLARDLGLQPRQVAVWFQNRRARWKTKQLEKDYGALKSSYNALKVDYETLLKEKEKLNSEVLSLTDKLLLKELGNKGTSEMKKASNQLQNVNCFQASDAKRIDAPNVSFKQEDLSSTNNAIFSNDSESGAHTPLFEPADSSNAFEAEKSDLSSHVEEDEEVKRYSYMKLEDRSDNYDFIVQDQALWCWSY